LYDVFTILSSNTYAFYVSDSQTLTIAYVSANCFAIGITFKHPHSRAHS
jgi:hypothetical protein